MPAALVGFLQNQALRGLSLRQLKLLFCEVVILARNYFYIMDVPSSAVTLAVLALLFP
jgi:hypothetical protein